MNIALIVVAYIAAVILLLAPWPMSTFKTKIRKHVSTDPYRAISLACDSESCQEMGTLGDRRFLVVDVPELPPQQCVPETCTCRYVHHDDRRDSVDRRHMSRPAERGDAPDRRSLRGRRKSDWSLLAVSG